MALQYRKKVRDAVVALLSDKFNAALAGLAATYGIKPFSLDFSANSTNVAIAHIDPSQIERCSFLDFPALCIYTTEVVNSGGPKQYGFAGKVMANLDFYVRDREGVEGFNTEDEFDAIEDAAVSILQDLSNQWPGGAVYSRDLEMGREYLIPLADGFATRIPIKAVFEVYVQ